MNNLPFVLTVLQICYVCIMVANPFRTIIPYSKSHGTFGHKGVSICPFGVLMSYIAIILLIIQATIIANIKKNENVDNTFLYTMISLSFIYVLLGFLNKSVFVRVILPCYILQIINYYLLQNDKTDKIVSYGVIPFASLYYMMLMISK